MTDPGHREREKQPLSELARCFAPEGQKNKNNENRSATKETLRSGGAEELLIISFLDHQKHIMS